MSDPRDDSPNVLIFPPWLFLTSAVLGAIAHVVCPYRLALSLWVRCAGGALWLGAIALIVWGALTLKAAGTNVRPDLPVIRMVTNGPFAYTRNPLYLGVVAVFAGIGIATASAAFLTFLVPLFVVLHYGVVLREERYLEDKFGDLYRGYKARVRRWI